MAENEFYCPVYEGMVSQYDCDEISYGAETGRFVNDGLPFLMPIEAVVSCKDICQKCEHNASNKTGNKQLIAAVEGKDLNEDTIHDLALLIQQAVKQNAKKSVGGVVMDDKMIQENIDILAKEIDSFSKKYDYYGYCDAVDDFDAYWEQLTTDIYNGDVQYLLDWLEPIVEEEDEYSTEAKELAEKLRMYM